jgi:hypothetical protein
VRSAEDPARAVLLMTDAAIASKIPPRAILIARMTHPRCCGSGH